MTVNLFVVMVEIEKDINVILNLLDLEIILIF